jgi:cellobiose transport system substrate-binding protein
MATRHGRRARLALATLAASVLLVSACGDDSGSGSGEDGGQITLTVQNFGLFGYKDALYAQYMKDHPNIKIVEQAEGDLTKYTNALTQRIAAGRGAGDVVAIEEGAIIQFLQAKDRFVNMQDYGSADLKTNWLDWKYDQATTADGSYTIGLGTDVGGLAMCYRKDLFAAAGLPTERTEVANLWSTWDAFIETGKKFQAQSPNKQVHFIDSATNTYNSILMQTAGQAPGWTYFDKDNGYVAASNPAVRGAWDQTTKLLDANLSANLKSFTNEWNAAFKNGAFATIACPAWMTGYIEGQAGESGKEKWDITTVPGNGGNWGGSWLAVPKQSQHQKEAVDLAKFLTSPESQLEAFKAAGNLPSSPKDHADPALLAATNPYFSGAPVGELFVKGAANLKPVYLGTKNQAVRDAFENNLRAVEQGQLEAGPGFDKAVTEGEAASGL